MRFSAQERLAAPPAAVFAALADVGAFEAALRRRGAGLRRTDTGAAPGVGTAWRALVPLGGRRLAVAARLSRLDPPDRLTLEGTGEGVTGRIEARLAPHGRGGTRLAVTAELRPATAKARILLHSLRLTKPALDRRFAERVARLARGIEAGQPLGGAAAAGAAPAGPPA